MGEFLHILLQNGGALNVKAPMLVLFFLLFFFLHAQFETLIFGQSWVAHF